MALVDFDSDSDWLGVGTVEVGVEIGVEIGVWSRRSEVGVGDGVEQSGVELVRLVGPDT